MYIYHIYIYYIILIYLAVTSIPSCFSPPQQIQQNERFCSCDLSFRHRRLIVFLEEKHPKGLDSSGIP